jgi:hypothetical protein
MSVDSTASQTPITIEDCKTRIEHLETLVSSLTKAEKSKKKKDPVKHSQNQLARYYMNRDEINAKRRAAYKAKKEAAAAAVVAPGVVFSVFPEQTKPPV